MEIMTKIKKKVIKCFFNLKSKLIQIIEKTLF